MNSRFSKCENIITKLLYFANYLSVLMAWLHQMIIYNTYSVILVHEKLKIQCRMHKTVPVLTTGKDDLSVAQRVDE